MHTETAARADATAAASDVRQFDALTRSSTLPSMSSMPAGTAGYHLIFFNAASGKLLANCALSLGSINWSAPLDAVKLPADAATLAAISGRMLKLIHA